MSIATVYSSAFTKNSTSADIEEFFEKAIRSNKDDQITRGILSLVGLNKVAIWQKFVEKFAGRIPIYSVYCGLVCASVKSNKDTPMGALKSLIGEDARFFAESATEAGRIYSDHNLNPNAVCSYLDNLDITPQMEAKDYYELPFFRRDRDYKEFEEPVKQEKLEGSSDSSSDSVELVQPKPTEIQTETGNVLAYNPAIVGLRNILIEAIVENDKNKFEATIGILDRVTYGKHVINDDIITIACRHVRTEMIEVIMSKTKRLIIPSSDCPRESFMFYLGCLDDEKYKEFMTVILP